MGVISVHHFGGLAVKHKAQIVALPADFPRGLFCFLASHPTQVFERQKIVETLWTDLSKRRAGAALSTALWRIKKVPHLKEMIDHPSRSTLKFAPKERVWVDTLAFRYRAMKGLMTKEATPAIKNLRRATQIYSAHPFSDLSSQWASLQMVELENLHLDCLASLCAWEYKSGSLPEAYRLARQVLQLEPYREDIKEIEIKTLRRQGNLVMAKNSFDAYCVMMRKELGCSPSFTLDAQSQKLEPIPSKHLTSDDAILRARTLLKECDEILSDVGN